MFKYFYISLLSLLLSGCTNLDERHVFNYKIEGDSEYVDKVHVVMGPGIDWQSDKKIKLPFDISHDIYGTELDYVFEVEYSGDTSNIILKVIIDEELVEEKTESLYDSLTETSRIIISGVFKD